MNRITQEKRMIATSGSKSKVKYRESKCQERGQPSLWSINSVFLLSLIKKKYLFLAVLVFIAVSGLSLVLVSRGYSSVVEHGL